MTKSDHAQQTFAGLLSQSELPLDDGLLDVEDAIMDILLDVAPHHRMDVMVRILTLLIADRSH